MVVVVLKGRPISIQATAKSINRWKSEVANAARGVFPTPLDGDDLRITITFFHNILPDFDTDNVSKPICDALEGVAYHDDSQLMDRHARRRPINGSFRIKGIDPKIATGIAEGDDFVAIEIEKIGSGGVNI